MFLPAMNTYMWQHPLTERHLSVLRGLGYEEIPPISKKLMCGDEGQGAMATVDTIVGHIHQKLQDNQTDVPR